MEPLMYFDCSCSIGMRGILYPDSFYKVADLLDRMKRYGIHKALVYHSMAREYNPVIGNKMLMEEIKNNPILLPVWVVMHHNTDEFPTPDDLLKQMKANNIKAVRMFPAPADQSYSIAEWNCGELLSVIEKHHIPLMLGLDQLGWNELHELCDNHPEMKLILTDVAYRMDRNAFALMKKFDNLFIETMGYKAHNGIEEMCSRFGAGRLVFGSSMPLLSGGAAVSMINYARISEDEKKMIAYKNMEDLLGGVLL